MGKRFLTEGKLRYESGRMGDAAPRRLRWHRLHGVSSEVKGGINGRLIRNRSCLRAAFLLGCLGWRPSFLERRHPRCLGLATKRTLRSRPVMAALGVPAQPVDATQALNLSAGVSNCKVSRGRSLS
jgi:hypothetical protein